MRWQWILVLTALLVLGIGLVVWEPTGPYSESCNLDAPLAEPPASWDWERDHDNDCAMTLFNDSGDRAPAELYAGTTIEPPPGYPQDWNGLGWALIVASFLGFAAVLPVRSSSGSHLDLEDNAG